MIVERLNNLKFNSNEIFENDDIFYKNGSLYISRKFANLIIRADCSKLLQESFLSLERRNLNTNIVYNDFMLSVNIYLKPIYWVGNKQKHNKLRVCGRSGDFGFGGLERGKNFKFGIRIKRTIYKILLEIYINSTLSRSEKLKEIFESQFF
jgi:hypothetical protein